MAIFTVSSASFFESSPSAASLSNAKVRQQVLAQDVLLLSRKLDKLLATYQAQVDEINALRQQTPRARKAALKLAATLKRKEKALLASQIPLQINAIKHEIQELMQAIADDESY